MMTWPVLPGIKAPTPAHDGCGCDCHRMPGVYHCVPCCGPGCAPRVRLGRVVHPAPELLPYTIPWKPTA